MRSTDSRAVRSVRARLRLPLTCIAFGAIAIAYYGIHLVAPGSSPVLLTVAELTAVSLPLTVAWFSFSGSCMLSEAKRGPAAAAASLSRFFGQAAFFAGIPVWAYWYLHLVFGVI